MSARSDLGRHPWTGVLVAVLVWTMAAESTALTPEQDSTPAAHDRHGDVVLWRRRGIARASRGGRRRVPRPAVGTGGHGARTRTSR